MRYKLKQCLSGLLSIIILLTSISIPAFADGDYIGGEGGNTGGSTGKGGDWSTDKQGYRVTVVDNTGAKMCEPVDYWFSTPTGNIAYYRNFKLEGMESGQTSKHILVSDMLSDPSFAGTSGMPPPLIWQNNRAVGNGEALKKWLLAGGNWNTQAGNAGGSGGSTGASTGGSGGGSGSGGSSPTEGWSKTVMDAVISSFRDNALKLLEENMSMYPPTPPQFFTLQLYAYATARCNIITNLQTITTENRDYMIDAIERITNEADLLYQKKYNDWQKYIDRLSITFDDKEVISEIPIAIPLADKPPATETEQKGYINPFLNYKDTSGQFVLDVQKPANYDATILKLGVEDLIENRIAIGGYYVFIEPIVWCTPLDRNWNRYPYGQVYGTITNFGQWANDMNINGGWDDNQLGGQMGSILNYSGAWSLWLNDAIPPKDGIAPNVHVPTKHSVGAGVINGELSKSDEGYALHVYTPNQITAGTHTWDNITYPTGDPGPAPEYTPNTPNPDDPTDPETPTDPTDPETPDNPNNPYKITIIKYYERNDTPESNFTREKNPSSIQIQDEPLYSLEDWFISSTKSIPTSQTTDYDEVKASISNASTGTTPQTVNVVDPNTTLYVKLVAIDPAVIPMGDLVIQQSQISKSISTLHNTAAGWGERTFNFSCASMSGSHIYYDGCGDDDDPCPGHNG